MLCVCYTQFLKSECYPSRTGLAGVSMARWQVRSAAFISGKCVSRSVPEIRFACCWNVKQGAEQGVCGFLPLF